MLCGQVESPALHLLRLQEIHQLLWDDQPGGGGCNEESFLVGQMLGQQRVAWVEFWQSVVMSGHQVDPLLRGREGTLLLGTNHPSLLLSSSQLGSSRRAEGAATQEHEAEIEGTRRRVKER